MSNSQLKESAIKYVTENHRQDYRQMRAEGQLREYAANEALPTRASAIGSRAHVTDHHSGRRPLVA